jgi:hypothetical protein
MRSYDLLESQWLTLDPSLSSKSAARAYLTILSTLSRGVTPNLRNIGVSLRSSVSCARSVRVWCVRTSFSKYPPPALLNRRFLSLYWE